MTTTDSFQTNPDFWTTKKEALNHLETTITNSRYKHLHFKQDIFHAGDEDQFQLFRDATNGNFCDTLPSLHDNLFSDRSTKIWSKHKKLRADAPINTFRYIFHKFKKGIFVKIVNNKLKVFLPFSKANFTNEWGEKIQIDPRFRTINDFFRYITESEGFYSFKEGGVNQNFDEWYGNNCLVRYEYPLSEGDSNVGNVKNMLEELCDKLKVPDIEFFINRRDFPILTCDGSEPYNHIWGTKELPLVSHSYEQYLPILSMSKSDRYADILMPTWDDWARIQSYESKYFPGTEQNYSETFDVLWSKKTATAVFRGASTGCGVDLKTNPRLHLAYLSTLKHIGDGGLPFLDACITKWNLRPRKLESETYLRTIDIEYLKSKKVDIYKRDATGEYITDKTQNYYKWENKKYIIDNTKGKYIRNENGEYKFSKHGNKIPNFLSPKQQSQYKYIVHVDGHVSAFRLSLELSMGSVILLVDSSWKTWYRDMLIEGTHYISVKEDLSNLIEQIQWCRDNDEICEQIANNALKFFNTYLQKDGVLHYMQKTLVDLKKEMGIYIYNSTSVLQTIIQEEYNNLDFSFPTTDKVIGSLSLCPNMERCYGLLQGIEWTTRKIIMEGNFESIATPQTKIFENTLGGVYKTELAGFSMVVKTTSNLQKIQEHIHEAFIATMSLNKLSKFIPNFAYIFGLYEVKEKGTFNVVTEFINGQTLFDYINSTNFSFYDFLFIVMQLCLALEVAQSSCGFVHYDLTPWNIVLQLTDTPKTFDYILSHNRVIRVRTSCIPVIIDFGKSHVIHQGIHHGFINMFNVSTIQDIIILLVRSLDQIINRISKKQLEINKTDTTNLLYLANFISNTKYCPNVFKKFHSVQKFLKNARKYPALIANDKFELEKLKPFDLVKYITDMKDYNFKSLLGAVKDYRPTMDKGNGRQVFEYVFSVTKQERLESFINVFYRLKKCSLPQPKNLFFIYYAVQSLERNLTSVRDNMIQFLQDSGITDTSKYEKTYHETMSFIETVYRKKIENTKEKNVEYVDDVADHFMKLTPAPYTEETFLDPKKILDLILHLPLDLPEDISDYKEIIEVILLTKGPYKLTDTDSKYYLEHFTKLLQTNSVKMKNNIANKKTLLLLADKIYQQDKSKLELNLAKKTCDEPNEYLELYKQCISKNI